MTKILYYGACWPTNIGNAFIDYASIYSIKKAIPDAKVFFSSELPRWLFKANKEDMDRSIDLAELIDADFVVVSGMALCDDFIEIEGPILKRLSMRGIKIVFNGCGGAIYDKNEIDNFRKFLSSIKVSGFISRDEISFNNFKDICSKSYNGIDCAFFLSEAFSAAPLTIKDYVIYNFDNMDQPEIENHNKKVIKTNHSCDQIIPKNVENKTFFKINKHRTKNKIFKENGILVSDIPDDYLHLYASAYAVYSDRVHACIAALSFGNYARLYSPTPRGNLFERVGVGQIREKLVKLDLDRIMAEKEKQLSFLRDIFKGR